MPRFAFVIAAIAFGISLAAADDAWACRCPASVSPATAYKRAHVVVTGKVASVQPLPQQQGTNAIVTVSTNWKKKVASEISVSTETTCAYNFEAGSEYLLYLFETKDGNYYTSLCAGNQPLAAAAKSMTWLRKSGKPSL